MPSDGAKFAQKTQQYATTWQRANRDAVNKAALSVKTSVMAQLAHAVGSDLRMSGVGSKGARLGVRYDVGGYYGNVTALVTATGPMHLVERDTKPHQIPRGQSSRRTRTSSGRLSNKRVTTGRARSQTTRMNMGGTWRTGPFLHPGTRGKHPFEKGVTAAEPIVRDVFRRAHTTSLARTFTGR